MQRLVVSLAVGTLGVVVSLAALLGPGASQASGQGFTTLDVSGEQVRIYRDDFGVPHIFAETNHDLFVAYGYTVAQDRLWQLELNRRARRGTLAEVLGSSSLAADRNARTLGYTDQELDAQFAKLTTEEQGIIVAYAEGLNRYITEVVAPDPLTKLPFEFHFLQIGVPAPWTVLDVVAVTVGRVTDPPNSGLREIANQSLLTSLIAKHGPVAGLGIFDDVRWLNDPHAPVSVPVEGAFGKRQKALPPHPAQLLGASENPPETLDEEARAILESLGVPTKLGSQAWVVSAAKSASGLAMLFGGPQVGFNTPEIFHEVQLRGGNGFDVAGVAIAGIPVVVVGRTDHVAWSVTTAGAVDNTDTYIETLCGGGTGYVFHGVCIAFESRVEIINVRGAAPVALTVQRTLHGPVVASGPGVRFSRKRAFRNRELEEFSAFLALNRAHSPQEFEAGVARIGSGLNFLYADRPGNIAYWQAGLVPLRPAGFDPRLPLPGDGTAEWPGGFLPNPASINPTRGWLANWNSKPSVDYDNPDHQTFGKQDRLLEIQDRLAAAGLLFPEDMRDIAKDIARLISLGDRQDLPAAIRCGGGQRDARFLKPYLLAALDSVPPAHPLAPQARAALEAWDGSAVADAVASTNLESGRVIFSAWLCRMLSQTFGDELGANVGEATANMLIHVLDDALGAGSGVPPSRDYFNGAAPDAEISDAFDQALTALVTALGPDPSAWSAQPRGMIRFRHLLFPTIPQVGTIPESNRGTYAQLVVLGNPTIASENILTLGQSGFIRLGPSNTPEFDSHFKDQLDLYREFKYKPMVLFKNTQLHE